MGLVYMGVGGGAPLPSCDAMIRSGFSNHFMFCTMTDIKLYFLFYVIIVQYVQYKYIRDVLYMYKLSIIHGLCYPLPFYITFTYITIYPFFLSSLTESTKENNSPTFFFCH